MYEHGQTQAGEPRLFMHEGGRHVFCNQWLNDPIRCLLDKRISLAMGIDRLEIGWGVLGARCWSFARTDWNRRAWEAFCRLLRTVSFE